MDKRVSRQTTFLISLTSVSLVACASLIMSTCLLFDRLNRLERKVLNRAEPSESASFIEKRHTLCWGKCKDGTPGPAGPKGEQGLPGVAGPQGPKGEQGSSVQMSIPGEQGVPGTQGVAGAVGSASETSATGPGGAPGASEAGGVLGSDVTFTRWGRQTCSGLAQLYLKGFAVGIESPSSAVLSSQDLQCVEDVQQLSEATRPIDVGPTMSDVKFSLHGTIPKVNTEEWVRVDQKRIPCAICKIRAASTILTYGTDCKSEWTSAYSGLVMAPYRRSTNAINSASICVERNPELVYPQDVTNALAAEYSFVRSGNSFTASNQLITCRVCYK